MQSNEQVQISFRSEPVLQHVELASIIQQSRESLDLISGSYSNELEAVYGIASVPASPSAKAEIFNVLFTFLQKRFHLKGAGFIARRSQDGSGLVELGRGSWLNLTGLCFELDGGAISQVLQYRKILHGHLSPFGSPFPFNGTGRGDLYSACLPLRLERDRLGVVWLDREVPFNPAELHLLADICGLAALSIRQHMLMNETQSLVEKLALINRASRALAEKDSLKEIFAQLSRSTRELLPDISGILISLVDSRSEAIHYAYGEINLQVLEETGLPSMPLSPFDKDVLSRVMLTGNSVEISELPEVTDMAILAGDIFNLPRSGVYVPLNSNGRVVGILQVQSSTPHRFTAQDVNILELLANSGGVTVQNFISFHQLRKKSVEVDQAYEAILEGWLRTLALRDAETEMHTRRVSELAVSVARAMDYPEEDLVHLKRGVLLHDIGKVGIPDEILLKPGPLTEDEWKTMRRHPVYAYQLLSPIPYLQTVLDIPYCHHEKWDGSGYPRALKGEEIPLSARIFAVIDVWDALTSNRPYRAAWTDEKARQYLLEQSGKHFDPQVVAAFFRVFPEASEVPLPIASQQPLPAA